MKFNGLLASTSFSDEPTDAFLLQRTFRERACISKRWNKILRGHAKDIRNISHRIQNLQWKMPNAALRNVLYGGVTADGYGVLFGGKDNILELDSDDSCTTLWMD